MTPPQGQAHLIPVRWLHGILTTLLKDSVAAPSVVDAGLDAMLADLARREITVQCTITFQLVEAKEKKNGNEGA